VAPRPSPTSRQHRSLKPYSNARPGSGASHRRAAATILVRRAVRSAPLYGVAARFFPQPLALALSRELS